MLPAIALLACLYLIRSVSYCIPYQNLFSASAPSGKDNVSSSTQPTSSSTASESSWYNIIRELVEVDRFLLELEKSKAKASEAEDAVETLLNVGLDNDFYQLVRQVRLPDEEQLQLVLVYEGRCDGSALSGQRWICPLKSMLRDVVKQLGLDTEATHLFTVELGEPESDSTEMWQDAREEVEEQCDPFDEDDALGFLF